MRNSSLYVSQPHYESGDPYGTAFDMSSKFVNWRYLQSCSLPELFEDYTLPQQPGMEHRNQGHGSLHHPQPTHNYNPSPVPLESKRYLGERYIFPPSALDRKWISRYPVQMLILTFKEAVTRADTLSAVYSARSSASPSSMPVLQSEPFPPLLPSVSLPYSAGEIYGQTITA